MNQHYTIAVDGGFISSFNGIRLFVCETPVKFSFLESIAICDALAMSGIAYTCSKVKE